MHRKDNAPSDQYALAGELLRVHHVAHRDFGAGRAQRRSSAEGNGREKKDYWSHGFSAFAFASSADWMILPVRVVSFMIVELPLPKRSLKACPSSWIRVSAFTRASLSFQ